MGINEIDLTIYPYTVGREDCKVLPRSFKTLAEAETYLAMQDAVARERGEFYLDGPEQDDTTCNARGPLDSDSKILGASPLAADLAEGHSETTPLPMESQATRGAWKREIEELCRALETQDAECDR